MSLFIINKKVWKRDIDTYCTILFKYAVYNDLGKE
jgi:hypothetical protein